MKAQVEFEATLRPVAGKGTARQSRREGRVPVVVYGNKQDSVSLTVDANKISQEYFRGGFMNKVVALKADGKTFHAIPRDIALNPVSDKIEHADFMHVDEKSQVKVWVPIHFLNAEKSVGIKRGGVLNVVRHDVELLCNVNSIPKYLEVNVAELNIGDSVHISNIALPEGVKPAIKRDFTIASIAGRMAEEEVATAAPTSAEVPATNAAAAQAAAAAAPAAAAPAKKK
ncbi:MAG: 50S ribosomal protein L25/general stress protein Ctc [Alphaproteobacteria bacterium]|nr:50S ribosomal protein L25/general stress protein Ctc [Alphaproteobacteria bacterium]